MLSKSLQVLKLFEVENEIILSRKIQSTVQKTIGCPKAKRISYDDCLHGTFTSKVSEEKVKMIKEELSSKQITTSFLRHPQLGEPFKKYENFYNLCDGQSLLVHEPGEVLCLNICSLYSYQSLQYLDYNHQLLQKYPHWREKVRTIAVFIGNKKQKIKEEVQKRKWHFFSQFLYLKQFFDHPFVRDYIIWNSCFMILVDKFGKTSYVGSQSQISLQKQINRLIQQQKSNEGLTPLWPSFFSEDEALKYISSLSPQRMEDQFKEIELFSFKLSVNINYTNNQVSARGIINATVMNEDLLAIEKAHSFFGNYPGIDLKINTVDYITVPSTEGAKCWQCNQYLQYPFYWLKWEEETKFGCRRCVEETTTLENHSFKYQKNSILLMDAWTKLAVKNIGTNIQPIHPKHIQHGHNYICSGCCIPHHEKETARYICQGCRMDPNPYRNGYQDFCQNNVEKMVHDDLVFPKQLKQQGHQSNHPLLRVLYNVYQYYLF